MLRLRLILYILAGITTALLGWNLSQATFGLLSLLENIPILSTVSQLRQWEDIIVFPFIIVCLSAGMVLNEIFITNPTRPKLNWRIAKTPLLIAIPIGLLAGVLIGGLLQIFYLPQFQIEERTVRVISWWCIGAVVGLIEGLTWRFYSMEAGDKERRRKRQFISLFAASLASVVAAGLFEIIRNLVSTTSESFQQIEDPLGFCILGALLGITFTFTTSPSYTAALRAGKGFEYSLLLLNESAISLNEENNVNKSKISIGSSPKEKKPNGKETGSDIYLPGLPLFIAHIEINGDKAILLPSSRHYEKIEIKGECLKTPQQVILHDDMLITFYTDENNLNSPKFYSFIYKYLKNNSIHSEFQSIDKQFQKNHVLSPLPPSISKDAIDSLVFISQSNKIKQIEEGLSIKLPEMAHIVIGGIPKKIFPNGSQEGADIYLPYTPDFVATIEIANREAKLIPNQEIDYFNKIKINNKPIKEEEYLLKHNTLIEILTDIPESDTSNLPKSYRFVYYNRFLDPEG